MRDNLRESLRVSIAVAEPERASPAWQPAYASTPALWFDPAEPLVINEDGRPGSKTVHAPPHAYVRILPRKWTLPGEFGSGRVGHPHILGPTQGFSWGTTRGGFLTYTGSLRTTPQQLVNFVMQFRATGELWGVSPFATDDKGDWFYADAFISHAHDFVHDNVKYLLKWRARGPFEIRMGVTDLTGRQWKSETRWGGRPIALEQQAEASFTLASNIEEARLTALEPAWGEIVAAFGLSQPPRSVLVQQIRGF